jgi:hypothetical protein
MNHQSTTAEKNELADSEIYEFKKDLKSILLDGILVVSILMVLAVVELLLHWLPLSNGSRASFGTIHETVNVCVLIIFGFRLVGKMFIRMWKQLSSAWRSNEN